MAATLTPGYVWSPTGQVTNVNLGTLVSAATISNIDQSNIASGYGLTITSSSAPSNTNALWLDSSLTNTPKYYNGSSWVAIGGATTGIRGTFSNLKSFWASNTTWTVTCDQINVKDASNNDQLLLTVNSTLNSASANGINALDTGTIANNTIYYIWVLAKSDGTKGIVYSLASAFGSVTLPTGYTYGALVSCLATNNSGNFIKATQTGRRYCFVVWANMGGGALGDTAWHAIDLTPANMTTNAGFVAPAVSNFCFGSLAAAADCAVGNDSSVASGNTLAPNKIAGAVGSANYSTPWQLDVITADTVYVVSNNAGNILYLHGFDLNKIT